MTGEKDSLALPNPLVHTSHGKRPSFHIVYNRILSRSVSAHSHGRDAGMRRAGFEKLLSSAER
jgi:hypothetical protein